MSITPAPDKSISQKVFIKSFGCQMNVYDSERMTELLGAQGYSAVESAEAADLVILNTCHIREKAVDKVYSEVGKLREMKQERQQNGGDMTIAVAGCVAQAEGHEIVRRAKGVDLVFGPQTYHRLPALLQQRALTQKPVVETEFPSDDKFEGLGGASHRRPHGHGVAAFVTIQEGCDKFCSFCVVPYTRGAEFSRPVSQVVDETQKLVTAGVREVTLLGQNVNAYRGSGLSGAQATLAILIDALSKIDGLHRIRYMTSHPRDMGDDLIAAHATNAKLMPYLHLPVQAGSDRVLKAMNRGHTTQHYVDLIQRIRKVRPDIAISGDFIVGFPGESDADFEDTLNIVRGVGYAAAYSFKYSERPGTPAADRKDQVPEEVKNQRLYRLQALLTAQMQMFNTSCVGKVFPVLIEKPGRQAGQMIGRSPYLQSVHLDAPGSLVGQLVNVKILSSGSNSLAGELEIA